MLIVKTEPYFEIKLIELLSKKGLNDDSLRKKINFS